MERFTISKIVGLPTELRERHVGHRRRYYKRPETRPMGLFDEPPVVLRADGSRLPVDISAGPN